MTKSMMGAMLAFLIVVACVTVAEACREWKRQRHYDSREWKREQHEGSEGKR